MTLSIAPRKWALLAVLAAALATPLAITPAYLGDTYRYAVEIATHRAGQEAPYWEFGHLLWRPWGGLGVSLCGAWLRDWLGDSETLAGARFLIATNWVAGAAGLLLLGLFLERRLPRWAAWTAAASCAATNAFLSYQQAGAPYVAGFFFTTLALYLLAIPGRWRPAQAGAAYAMAVCVWFPYAVVGLGVVAAAWFWRKPQERRSAVVELLAALVTVTAGWYLYAIWQNGFHSLAEIRQWVADSDNGWNQRLNVVRSVTGIPRGWLDLGGDTVTLKRWFFRDPYHPAGLMDVAGTLGWKLAAFYGGMAGVLWGVWRSREAREWRWIAAGAWGPLLAFAFFVFEPSSAERFLPAFPFVFGAVGAAFAGRGAPAVLAAMLPAAMLLGNLPALGGTGAERRDAAAARLQAVPAGSRVMLLNLRDEIYQAANAAIFDRRLNDPQRPFTDIIETGSVRAPHWRREFSRHAQAAWRNGLEVWVSERMWAEMPAREWQWVEGDEPAVRWTDLPAFFSGLETDQSVHAGRDGFRRLKPSAGNQARLAAAGP